MRGSPDGQFRSSLNQALLCRAGPSWFARVALRSKVSPDTIPLFVSVVGMLRCYPALLLSFLLSYTVRRGGGSMHYTCKTTVLTWQNIRRVRRWSRRSALCQCDQPNAKKSSIPRPTLGRCGLAKHGKYG